MNEQPQRRIIRRVLDATDAELGKRTERRSFMHKRNMAKTAHAIEDREKAAQEIQVLDDLVVTRHERAQVTLDESQQAAVDMVMQNQFGVIGGYAGTGKTTSMQHVLPRIEKEVGKIDWTYYRTVGRESSSENRRPAIALCTFTNIAARNLASKLPEEWSPHCMSIHSMLAFAPVSFDALEAGEFGNNAREGRFEPRYHEGNRLPLDAIFIDETGIVSRDLWHQILNAVEPHCRIYFLGDLAQLPALKGVSPMPFAIDKWPVTILDKIYRQKEGGELIENLTRIRRGVPPTHHAQVFRCGEKEVLPSAPTAARKYVAAYISTLYKMGVWDPAQDIILTAENEATLGQQGWNTTFRYAFNPERRDEKGIVLNPPILMRTAVGVLTLSIGDKVMATSSGGRGATERRFVNGSIGTITRIEPNPDYKGDMTGLGEVVNAVSDFGEENEAQHMFDLTQGAEEHARMIHDTALQEDDDEETKRRQASHIVTVVEQSTGEEYVLSRSSEVASLQHAYATTCHRFQGSQARNVLVICHTNMRFGLNREWLYTACSRAQKAVFLMHEPRALQTAIQRQTLKGRNPQEKADYLRHIYEGRGYGIPELPENRLIGG